MKRHIKFEYKNLFPHEKQYIPHPNNPKILSLLELAVLNISPKSILRSISAPNYTGHITELVEHSIKGENIIIKESEEHFKDDGDRFIMKFKDFKKMVLQWKELYERKAPEIYFILEDNGSVTVQDHLEDNETNN